MSFYQTREWKELRYKVLLHYGRKCLCCNSTDKPLHVDHIKPISKYPELKLEITNLQVLCEDCNLGKSNKDETDFRKPSNKVPTVKKLPPGSLCWVKFKSNTWHRWSGSDTLCRLVLKKFIDPSSFSESATSVNRLICSDCKRILLKNKVKRSRRSLNA